MMIDSTRRPDHVIDAAQWLEDRVESLIEAKRFQEAIRYLRQLSLQSSHSHTRRRCATYLGYLYLLVGQLDDANTWLQRARQSAPDDPHLLYALGHLAAAEGQHCEATLRFLEAFSLTDQPHDEAEFLRSGALGLMRVTGPGAGVAAMLLGALDRDLGNPWILDALARVYEADQRWMETLEMLSMLADVVEDATDSVVIHRAPTARQLLRNRLMGRPVSPEELRRRARAVNQAVREQFEVVLDEHHRRGPTELTPLRLPPAINRLVRVLEWRDRGVELVETAQTLWARARGAQFDEMLGAERLAAAIHVITERLHWRVTTPSCDVARVHGASLSAIPAAARVVAGRLELELFDVNALKTGLDFQRGKDLDELARALLVGESVDDVREEFRLGS